MMTDNIEIRESQSGDVAAIEALYPAAFPDEDLLPVVRDLLREGEDVLSLVAIVDGTLAGHVIFTACGITGRDENVALLAPLAVAPSRQRHGIGGDLVRAGLRQMKNGGAKQAFVLGDPAYYGRFGFRADDRTAPPYPMPDEWRDAWQSLVLVDGDFSSAGTLSVPAPWRSEALWAP